MQALGLPLQALAIAMLLPSCLDVPEHLAVVELFCGKRALSRACQKAQLATAYMDITIHDDHDFCSVKGFLCGTLTY